MNEPIAFNTKDVMEKIIKVRGMDVLLDRDVAELYGVETKRVNEALKNNPEKFPEGYVLTLHDDETCKLVENLTNSSFCRLKP
jgi:hypothetical protein